MVLTLSDLPDGLSKLVQVFQRGIHIGCNPYAVDVFPVDGNRMDLVFGEQFPGNFFRFLAFNGDAGNGAGKMLGLGLVKGNLGKILDLVDPMVFELPQPGFFAPATNHLMKINCRTDGYF